MFGPEFFPTPSAISYRMLKRISENAVHFLEPSAGKGDLAKAILSRGENRWGRNALRVDVIEQQPELLSVLRGIEEVNIVGFDWLTYGGVSYYDAIVMNPPFSNGAAHLLRAWDFLHAGEIVCLLNWETVDNPRTEERRRLAEIIREHGDVEDLGECFRSAERPTGVRVAMVYLKKTSTDDRIEVWSTTGSERPVDDRIDSADALPALRDKLGNLEHYYNQALAEMFKGFAHVRKAALFMDALGAKPRGEKHESADLGRILDMATKNITSARAEFTRTLRRGAWMHALNQMEFQKWLDSKQTEQLMRDVEQSSALAFTAENVKGTLENIFLSRRRLFEQSVWNVFEALTRHYKGNATGDVGSGDGISGWKSNDSYKVNLKLVFPYGCRYSFGSFDIYSRQEAGAVYTDLDRVLAILDGQPFEKVEKVCDALLGAFGASKKPGTVESTYFKIRYFKKGTVHLTWKRRDLWERFNVAAAAGRRWVGENTQSRAA